jgi:hypothetical protein
VRLLKKALRRHSGLEPESGSARTVRTAVLAGMTREGLFNSPTATYFRDPQPRAAAARAGAKPTPGTGLLQTAKWRSRGLGVRAPALLRDSRRGSGTRSRFARWPDRLRRAELVESGRVPAPRRQVFNSRRGPRNHHMGVVQQTQYEPYVSPVSSFSAELREAWASSYCLQCSTH